MNPELKPLKLRYSLCAICILATALVGFRSQALQAQTTILSEDFEGNFPSDNGWTVGDSNASGTPSYWGTEDASFGGEGTHGGNRKGYCAGIGHGGTTANPTYQNSMTANMSKTIDLSAYTGASLSFWYKTPSIESGGFDKYRVFIDSTLVWEATSSQASWSMITTNLNSYAGSSHSLRFEFASDGSGTGEGWYLDDISVQGTQGCQFEFLVSDVRLTVAGTSQSCPVTLSAGGQTISGTFDGFQRSPNGNFALHRVAVGFRDVNGVAVGNCNEATALARVPASCAGVTRDNVAVPAGITVPTTAGTYTLWAEDYLTVSAPCALFGAVSERHTTEITMKKMLCTVTLDGPCVQPFEFVVSEVRQTFDGTSQTCPVTVPAGGQTVGGTFDGFQSSPDGNFARHRVAVGFRNSNGLAVGNCADVTALDTVPAACAGLTGSDVAIPPGITVPTTFGIYTLWAEDYLTVNRPCTLFAAEGEQHTTETAMKKLLCTVKVGDCPIDFLVSDVRLTFNGTSHSCPVSMISGGQTVGGTFDAFLSSASGYFARHRVALGFRDADGVAVGNCREATGLDSVPLCPGGYHDDGLIPSGIAVPANAGTYTLWAEDYLTVDDPCALFTSVGERHTAETTMKKVLCSVTYIPPVFYAANGHYYVFISTPLTWEQARAEAESWIYDGSSGHLATIQDQAENDFVAGLLLGGTAWIGGFQDPYAAEPGGGWGWITGEPFTFTAWHAGEPNDGLPAGTHDLLQLYGQSSLFYRTWNDTGDYPDAFMVEFEPIFNGSISILRQAGQVILSWAGTGTLQESDETGNPWTWADMVNQTNPLVIDPAEGQKFYRLRTGAGQTPLEPD